jgi:hypothetical protein
MSAHNQNTQITYYLDTYQNPNEYRVVCCEYKYNNKEEEKISDPYGSKDFP